ncbi:MAG: hypothetical protein ACI8PZ_000996 [Myxococcota bacterium]|jgi:hypothetical protein
MTAFLESPRVQDLLRQADSAQALLHEITERGGDAAPVREALNAVLRDLGHAVWTDARSEATLPGQVPGPAPRAYSDDDAWYTEEIEVTGRLFDPGDLADVVGDDLPTDDVTDPDADGYQLETLSTAQLRPDDASDAVAELRGTPAPPWAERLASLRDLLGAPSLDESEEALGREAMRVQWGAANVDRQLTGLPDSVRTILIASMACRARRVMLLLDDAIGLDLALERLRRYRLTEHLPMVVALTDVGRPERGAWIRDARAWWQLIDPGAR